jgi:exodeoxyribonuclease V alpha subunit
MVEKHHLHGEVQSIVFASEDTGFVIARVRSKDHPGRITIIGELGTVVPGEILEMTGSWAEHPKYGSQFKVDDCRQLLPASVNGIKRYLGSGLIKGLGPVMAQRMIAAFGARVLTILDKDPDRLLRVEGIGEKKLASIKASWEEHREIRGLMLFLQSHDIPPTFAGQIHRRYGSQAVSLIQKNPYQLAYEIRGIGFKTADAMALKLGMKLDNPLRLEAGIHYTLNRETENGHLFVPKEHLLTKTADILGATEPSLLDEALQNLHEKKQVEISDLPEQGIEQAVYLIFFYALEKEISERLHALAAHPAGLQENRIREAVQTAERAARLELSIEQRQAVLEACTSKVYVITGGPGTGKTTITRMIVDTFSSLGLKLALAAPTGRAAKRLFEATGHGASTIHRLLGFTAGDGFTRNEGKKLKAQAVIVDEASMIDGPLFLQLLRALPLTCRLILVGDMHQLPSVGPGNILGDIIGSASVPGITLTRIFRQARNSTIVVNAHLINEGKFPVPCTKKPPEADFFWIENQDIQRVRDIVVRMVSERIPQVYGLDPLRDIQVLTPMHKGDVGTQALNRLLQNRLNPHGQEFQRGQRVFRVGDRVLQTKNNYEKEIFNGDLGRIAAIDTEDQQVLVDFDDTQVNYESDELDELVLAYAVSVHKSQGSEYPAVVIPVVTQHYVLLKRNLIYTALTRARKLAVMVGSRKALATGIARREGTTRNSHLRFRLQHAFNS